MRVSFLSLRCRPASLSHYLSADMSAPNKSPPQSHGLESSSRHCGPFTYLCQAWLLTLAISTPFVVSSAFASWQNNNNDLITWADQDLPIRKQFETFVQYYGRPELIVLSWPGCEIDSAALQNLADQLERETPTLLCNIATTKYVVDQLSKIPGGVDEAEIRHQLRGVLVGLDGQQACLVAELSPTAIAQRPIAIARIEELAAGVGVSRDEIRFGGIGAELAAFDYESVAAPARLTPIIGLCMLVLCSLFLRSWRLGLFLTMLGSYAGALSAAIIEWAGVQSNGVLATLPTLGGLLTLSLSLHFVGYYKNARLEAGNSELALRQAFSWAWKPTLVSAITTALGLGSLTLSRTLTIQQFGLFGAIIAVCAAFLVLSSLPAFLFLAHSRIGSTAVVNGTSSWNKWMAFLERRSQLIIIVVSIAACLMGAGLTRLRTSVYLDNLFVPDHRIIEDGQWLEDNIGPMASLEVVLSFPNRSHEGRGRNSAAPLDLANDLMLLQRLSDRLRTSDKFSVIVSAATGLPDFSNQRGIKRVAAIARLRKWLQDHHAELLSSGLYAEMDGNRNWRISVRIPNLGRGTDGEANSELERQLRAIIDKVLAAEMAATDDSAPSYFVTGLPLLFEQIERQFLEDLLVTYLGGLLLITTTVLLVLRRVSDAATAMIPNVLPAVGVLGGISLLWVELDVGSVMTASIALGVAVDDTLHFILWYQRTRKTGLVPKESVRSAVTHCGPPILQTSVICGVGLAILGFAPFLPTARFGTLIALMLVVALIGDLLFLPAMLLLRTGSPSPKLHNDTRCSHENGEG